MSRNHSSDGPAIDAGASHRNVECEARDDEALRNVESMVEESTESYSLPSNEGCVCRPEILEFNDVVSHFQPFSMPCDHASDCKK